MSGWYRGEMLRGPVLEYVDDLSDRFGAVVGGGGISVPQIALSRGLFTASSESTLLVIVVLVVVLVIVTVHSDDRGFDWGRGEGRGGEEKWSHL